MIKLTKIYSIIRKRIEKLPVNSRVAKMYKEGEDRIIQKVGEEAVEVLVAAKNSSRKRIVSEIADLWFMTLVLMAAKEISPDEISDELGKRNYQKQTTEG